MTNKIYTVLKVITDRMAGALPRDTVKNPKLNVNSTSPVLSAQVEEQEEKDTPENINTNPSLPPGLSVSFITEKFPEGNSLIENNLQQNDDSHIEEPGVGENARTESEVKYFDVFPTRSELAYHKLYLMRISLEVLRKFHRMILRGRFNQLLHVSSPLLSKPGEY
ncbi:hypothetical protein Tco_0439954 [Tanacetum coccineum]